MWQISGKLQKLLPLIKCERKRTPDTTAGYADEANYEHRGHVWTYRQSPLGRSIANGRDCQLACIIGDLSETDSDQWHPPALPFLSLRLSI
ncbi:hypothetical protein PUN28_014391 [Cardiocondyla obscurior]|uniref:Uncharacterized protein n=1 Tax=Cardiocondyla obscurior TaxID=286306 RepID=A0AAW2F560_9HYME